MNTPKIIKELQQKYPGKKIILDPPENPTEIYEAKKGILTVYVSGKKHILQEGEKITIEPNTVHYVTGEMKHGF